MKVQITERELRDVLLQLHTRANGKVLVGGVELELLVSECKERDQRAEVLSPEEQIRRNPALALDTPEPLTIEQIQTELLRWFERPEQARGRWHDVPHGHPSGFGGQKIYIPRDFPLSGATK